MSLTLYQKLVPRIDDLETKDLIIGGVLGGVLALVIIALIVLFTYANNINKQLEVLRLKIETGPDSGLRDLLPRLDQTPTKPPFFGGIPSVRGNEEPFGFPRQNPGRNNFQDMNQGFGRPGSQPQRPPGFGNSFNNPSNSGAWSQPQGPQRTNRPAY